MSEKKILFIDQTHPCLQEELEEMGFVCDFFPEKSKEDIEKVIHQYTGVILRSRILLDKKILEKAAKLRFIGRVGAGMESIDMEYATSKNIICLNSPEGNRDSLAEHTLGMLLMLLNKLNIADKQIRQGIRLREENRGMEIKGKTIGIIGYGNMGGAFAQRLKGFQANVIAYDKYKFNYSDEFVKETSWDEILEKADIISFHVPLTSETKYLFDQSLIDKFKKNIYLINTSRGKVVNTGDLVEGIMKGKVYGAALDVIEYEDTSFEKLDESGLPEAYRFLLHAENVVMTPHIAGWTIESKYKLAKVLADKIRALKIKMD
jgi:D-3-phosphoglycerate dehydrogenase / 2-oxoglutarate reductase